MDKLDFLDSPEGENADVQPHQEPQAAEPETVDAEAPPEETPEQKTERERDERGRFKAKEEADEPVMVPLKALHETRDELKALKAEIEQYRQKPEPQQTQAVPDIFEDPDGFVAFQNQQMSQAIYAERLNMSHRFAEQKHGADAVAEAMKWGQELCARDPQFNAAVMSNADPVGFAVSAYQREQMLSRIGDDPNEIEAFLTWKQAQQQQPAQANHQPEPTPQPSIASAPSAGGMQTIATGPGVAFDNVIK